VEAVIHAGSWQGTGRTFASIVGAALLVLLMVVPSFWALGGLKASAETRKHTFDVINRGEILLGALRDAETSQRGYLLTGDETFLEPYQAVRDGIDGQLAELRHRTHFAPAQQHLEALAPLVTAKLAELAHAIDLRRDQRAGEALAVVRGGQGKRLMDSIRAEISAFTEVERGMLAGIEAQFHSRMSRLFAIIVAVSLLTLLIALLFIYLVHRQAQQRLRDRVHLETRHLLEDQEETNRRLLQINFTLQESEENLAVTLNSIGDAVIATDAQARVTRMNPVAEKLTGWCLAEAKGRSVTELFNIVNQATRQPSVIPVLETLKYGTVHGLANHTILIARDGREADIADSCAPIRDRDQQVIGAVLVFRDVTQEYASQRALRDSSTRIHAILSTAVDGIITFQAREGLVESVNPAAEWMFGYTSEELIGQSIIRLIPELDQGSGATSLDQFQASDQARAMGLEREVLGRRQDGRFFPLEIVVSEMELGGERFFTGVLRDITARKEAEAALLKAGALQNAIFNSANFSSIATDAKGVIQIFNVGAERMLGYAAAEVMNKVTPADISDASEVIARAKSLSLELGTQIRPGFEALVFKASRGIEDIYELTYIRKDGSRFPAVVSVTALRDAENAIIGYLLIGTDNTARKQVEADRARLDEALEIKHAEWLNAKVVAEKANLAKSEFLSSMSHELRSPLNAILGFAQLMDSEIPAPTLAQKASLDQILHAGWYLLDLVNEILDLAVIESGKLSLSPEPVLLAEILFDCHAMIQPQAEKRGIKLVFPKKDLPVFVQADRVRLKQVLVNLLSNAIKYNILGGTVAVTCATVTPGRTRVSVRDTGHGLAPDMLRQLFQPFNRLGQENSAEDGTGIGLVMSKLLVELMGGSIGVESSVGVGSLFWFELNTATPLMLGDGHFQSKSLEPPALSGSTRRRTVLYVEDNPANLSLVEQLIARRPDLDLLSAENATLGIEFARAHRPDVILMDINLPGLNGFQALAILREDPGTRDIPVIAISANAMVGDITKGLVAGFFRYITKPINVVEFMEVLDIALESPAANT
jgi:PAS domain S-box-containing protein